MWVAWFLQAWESAFSFHGERQPHSVGTGSGSLTMFIHPHLHSPEIKLPSTAWVHTPGSALLHSMAKAPQSNYIISRLPWGDEVVRGEVRNWTYSQQQTLTQDSYMPHFFSFAKLSQYYVAWLDNNNQYCELNIYYVLSISQSTSCIITYFIFKISHEDIIIIINPFHRWQHNWQRY